MIITERHAKRLIKKGTARTVGFVRHEGVMYGVLSRFDAQRTDHFIVAHPNEGHAAQSREVEVL